MIKKRTKAIIISETKRHASKIAGGFKLIFKSIRVIMKPARRGSGAVFAIYYRGAEYYDYRSDMTFTTLTNVVNDFLQNVAKQR